MRIKFKKYQMTSRFVLHELLLIPEKYKMVLCFNGGEVNAL